MGYFIRNQSNAAYFDSDLNLHTVGKHKYKYFHCKRPILMGFLVWMLVSRGWVLSLYNHIIAQVVLLTAEKGRGS